MKSEPVKNIQSLGLSIMLLIALSQVVSAAAVSLKVETIEGSGPSIEVPITAGKCEGLGALQFNLSYDPAIVEPESVEAGTALSNSLIEFNVKSPGQLAIALIASTPVNGPGELLKVRFKLVGTEGGSTDLAITEETAWDYENSLEMLITTEPGSLSLTPGDSAPGLLLEQDWTIPLIIGTVILLALILLVTVGSRRRKTQVHTTAPSSESGDGFCEKCGNRHNAEAKFCPKCGHAVRQ